MRIPAGIRFPTLWVAKDLMHHEGIRGFYRGLMTNQLIGAMEGSVFAGTYEGSKYFADITDIPDNVGKP
jgi:hypothetical protein